MFTPLTAVNKVIKVDLVMKHLTLVETALPRESSEFVAEATLRAVRRRGRHGRWVPRTSHPKLAAWVAGYEKTS